MASNVIRVSLLGDAKDLQRAFDQTGRQAQTWGDKMGAAGRKLTTNVTLPIIGAGVAVVGLAAKQEKAEAKLAATFDSMGASAWTTTDALHAHASALQEVTTHGDEAIMGAQDLLLTFGNVRNEVGKGNDIFDQATALALDMSDALGQDLKSSSIQLGKALNDPIKGVSALQRVGVSFTEAQKDQIKTLVESGDEMGAQKIILAELEKQFGGTAAAVAETSEGKMKQAMNTLGDAGESLGTILLPVITQVAGVLKDLGERFKALSPETKKWIVRIVAAAAAIGPLLIVGAKLVSAFNAIMKAFKALQLLMMANPWLLLIAAIIGLVVIVVKNWDKIKAVIGKAWDWVKEKTRGFVEFLKNIFLNFTPLGLIIKNFDKIKSAATGVKDWIVSKFNTVVDFFKNLPGRIGSAVAGMWDGIKNAFRSAINWVIDKWNNFSFKAGFNIPSIFGGGRVEIGFDTPNIPRLHSGGLFQAPNGAREGLALLESGERVLPRHKSGSGEGSSIVINVSSLDPRSAAVSVMEALQEYERRYGPLPLKVRV